MNRSKLNIFISCFGFMITESSIIFDVYPTSLSQSGEWVKVSWNHVQNPSNTDWVGVYSPPLNDVYRINPAEHAPVKLQVCAYSMLYHTFVFLCLSLLVYRGHLFLHCSISCEHTCELCIL